jgi:hypothetical protein
MIRIAALAIAGLIAGLPVFTMANENAMDVEEQCKIYAKEDGVLESEMETYLKECIDSLSAPAAGESEAPAADAEAPKSE